MKQTITFFLTAALMLASLSGLLITGPYAAYATSFVDLDDLTAKERTIPHIRRLLINERAILRTKIKARAGSADEMTKWKQRVSEVADQIENLTAELRRVRKCRRALRFAQRNGIPYPEVQPGETTEELDQRLREYRREVRFRLKAAKRALRAAKESYGKEDPRTEVIEQRRDNLKELLKKIKNDRSLIESGQINLTPLPQPVPVGKIDVKTDPRFEEGLGYVVTLPLTSISVPFDSTVPVYTVSNPFNQGVTVTLQIKNASSETLLQQEVFVPAGALLDVSSIMIEMPEPDLAETIIFSLTPQ